MEDGGGVPITIVIMMGTAIAAQQAVIIWLFKWAIGKCDDRVKYLEGQQAQTLQSVVEIIRPVPEAMKTFAEALKEIRFYLPYQQPTRQLPPYAAGEGGSPEGRRV